MRKLTLVGLSADGRQAVFVDDMGAEFATPADDRLRAALRGDRVRLGQLEIEMESVLRPRDIQARIRSGESVDAVAALAQVSVDKILPYCLPVLAERQHVAELARRSHVRRKNVDGPSKRLVDVVAERLRSRGVDPVSAEWDAWRQDDGRWSVQATYHSGERARSALFIFDSVGRYSIADDDEAKWLTGERQSTRKGPQPRSSVGPETGDDGAGVSRRLAAVPDEDALLRLQPELATFEDDTTDDLTAVVRAIQSDEEGEPSTTDALDDAADIPADATTDTGLDADDGARDGADDGEADSPDEPGPSISADNSASADERLSESATPVPQTEPTPERKRRGSQRASVPSWDEIMFGKGKDQ